MFSALGKKCRFIAGGAFTKASQVWQRFEKTEDLLLEALKQTRPRSEAL